MPPKKKEIVAPKSVVVETTTEAPEEALCKYAKFAEKWLPDDEKKE